MNNEQSLEQQMEDFAELQEGIISGLTPEMFVVSNLENIPITYLEYLINNKKFGQGINEMAETCGKIYALAQVGVSPSEALLFIHNARDLDEQMSTIKYQTDKNVEISKNNTLNTL